MCSAVQSGAGHPTTAPAANPPISLSGVVLGYWLIASLNETASELIFDGNAQRIEFQLALKRYDGRYSEYGKLAPLLPLITRLF